MPDHIMIVQSPFLLYLVLEQKAKEHDRHTVLFKSLLALFSSLLYRNHSYQLSA